LFTTEFGAIEVYFTFTFTFTEEGRKEEEGVEERRKGQPLDLYVSLPPVKVWLRSCQSHSKICGKPFLTKSKSIEDHGWALKI
jgi:hypothetical protein